MSLSQAPADFSPAAFRRLDPTKYVSLGDFINQVNKPDNRDMLVKTYGNQTITGFLQMTGAVKSNGTADDVQYWEETRLHPAQTVQFAAAGVASTATSVALVLPSATATATGTLKAQAQKYLRVNDVILINGADRFIVTAITSGEFSQTATAGATAVALDGTLSVAIPSGASGVIANVPIVGNLFSQGSDQNQGYLESDVVKRTNPYMILKEVYKVTGSQATNIGWINLGNGDYRWYIKSEQDTRKRFLDKREMMMLLGVRNTNEVAINGAIEGSEGYFSAIENRGMVNSGYLKTLSDIDAMVTEFDKQGSAPEYAMYVNRAQDLYLDDLIARGLASAVLPNPTNGALAYGNFNNGDAALKLGFTSFKRGSYTFHKQAWKLLNEPTLLSGSVYKGVAIPMSTVVDPKTGDRSPALEMNYKSTNGYSREMEHWMTGSILGVSNTNVDSLQFNYRSECNLVTRAANRHLLIKGSTAE
jgi:hypothetical protein